MNKEQLKNDIFKAICDSINQLRDYEIDKFDHSYEDDNGNYHSGYESDPSVGYEGLTNWAQDNFDEYFENTDIESFICEYLSENKNFMALIKTIIKDNLY